jgi:UDP-N-acetylglucosamine:LPS N-acetylglucosamine transferase
MKGKMDILFFSRGRGKGHAVPDLAIIRELRGLLGGIRISFVSYAVGAEVLQSAGEHVLNLGLPEMNPLFDTLARVGSLLRRVSPRLIIAHEEPAVLTAARIFAIPNIFLTHWFPSSEDPFVEIFEHADRVLFMEKRGLFSEPKQARGRVKYLGPVLRQFQFFPKDRESVRKELGLQADEAFILVLPGSPPEATTPICELVRDTFQQLTNLKKRVVWVAGKDYQHTVQCVRGVSEVDVIDFDRHLDRLMVACDLAITKGTYNTGRELMSLGIPTITLSHGHNHIDDLYSRSFYNNTFLWRDQTDPVSLAKLVKSTLNNGPAEPDLTSLRSSGPLAVAKCIAEEFEEIEDQRRTRDRELTSQCVTQRNEFP